MEFADVVRRRRMVRNYEDRPVSDDAINRILEAARRAPSAGNSQGQAFVVVTDPERRRRIAELCDEPAYVEQGFDPWISRAPAHIAVCVSKQRYLDRYAEPDKGGTLVHESDWPIPYWWVDAGASLMLILLAAVDEGLAAGFLGSHAIADLHVELRLPPDMTPIGIVTVGHAAPDRRSSSLDRGRRPRPDVVHDQTWSS